MEYKGFYITRNGLLYIATNGHSTISGHSYNEVIAMIDMNLA